MSVPHGVRVLELGCGRGIGLGPLALIVRPALLVGLDNRRDLLEHARRRLDETAIEARLVCGDIRAMPLADDSIDVIVDFGSCYHLTEPSSHSPTSNACWCSADCARFGRTGPGVATSSRSCRRSW